jgi:NodT family efflux transporter outer membrane factor (OMF) lipoprotein
MKQSLIVLSFFILFLGGCSSHKKKSCKPVLLEVPCVSWVDSLHEPLLTTLVQRLLKQSLDIKIAQERVKEARANELVTKSRYFPDMALNGRSLIIPTLRMNQLPTQNTVLPDGTSTILLGGLSANWEIDVFGKTRAAVAAAHNRVESQQALVDDAVRIVVAELCKAFIEWREYYGLTKVTLKFLAFLEDLIQLYRSQFEAGLRDERDVLTVDAQKSSVQSLLYSLESLKNASSYAIDRLLNEQDVVKNIIPSEVMPVVPSATSVGDLPIELLKCRPDIRSARSLMLAAKYDLKEAEAALWPSLSLSSFLGFIKIFNSIIKEHNPFYVLAPVLNLPFLNFGRLRGAVNAADARSQAALFDYEKTISIALEEARTAFSDFNAGLRSLDELKNGLEAQHHIESLELDQYQAGLVAYSDYVPFAITVLQEEAAVIVQQAKCIQDYIRVAKAFALK